MRAETAARGGVRQAEGPRTSGRVPIRVLVAEDSLFARNILVRILEAAPGIEVAGVARNGEEAVEMAARLRPDVVTMDIRMPVMDGFEATQRIMARHPTRILVISSSVGQEDLRISFNAIQAGALDIIEKPRGNLQSGYDRLGAEIVRRIRLVSEIHVFRHIHPVPPPCHHGLAHPGPPLAGAGKAAVAVGASTGGPSALLQVLQCLPAGFPATVFVTQHIAEGFGRGCAEWLGRNCALEVKVAESGERVRPGVVYFAPDRGVLTVADEAVRILAQRARQERMPIDAMISSVAAAYRERTIGVLLTGMGNDGVEGLRRVKAAGGRTVVQDEHTSVVYGMPRAAAEAGLADQVLPIGRITPALLSLVTATGRGR